MWTARPAARPALAFFELGTHPFNMLSPRFGLFYRDGPADPFIARKRRDVFPCSERGLVGGKSFPQIRRDLVYDAAGDCFFRHMFFLAHWSDIVTGLRATENQKPGAKDELRFSARARAFRRALKLPTPELLRTRKAPEALIGSQENFLVRRGKRSISWLANCVGGKQFKFRRGADYEYVTGLSWQINSVAGEQHG